MPLARTRSACATESQPADRDQAMPPLMNHDIDALVARFFEHREAYRATSYKEAELRHEFLEPMFSLLGWDVHNRAGYASAYKDVVSELSLRVGDSVKAPDYCFRTGGSARFFVEAKRPNSAILEDGNAAFQVRRYAWSGQVPLAVLTSFDELALYDGRVQPKAGDDARVARIATFSAGEYADRWEEIIKYLGRESILKGTLDALLPAPATRRGALRVDEAFLADLESWRDVFAHAFSDANPGVTLEDLNRVVQRLLDRIVFLRILEDRGGETYGSLRDAVKLDRGFGDLIVRADSRYNSGLFAPNAELDPLNIDPEAIRRVVGNLYFPQSPYEFSVLPAHMLGAIYERFLGSRIEHIDGQIQIVQRPEVRKAGGVYYTPQYIVESILDDTLGRLLTKNASVAAVAKIAILDPACGSGAFLIAAYQRLLDWHLEVFRQKAEFHLKGKDPALFRGRSGALALTLATRRRILLNSIYGVDLDEQATEVTQLSLLLKVVEGETDFNQQALFIDRVLPSLSRNIRCGNSLIGPQFLRSLPVEELDKASNYRSFDWQIEFAEIMRRGGFDVVIGNPPYLSYAGRQSVSLPPEIREFYSREYASFAGWPTSHSLFIERAARDLSARFVSFIVPDQMGHLAQYGALRATMQQHCPVRKVKYWGEKVFEGVTTPALTFVGEKGPAGLAEVIDRHGTTNRGMLHEKQEWVFSANRALLNKLANSTHFSLGELVRDCGFRTTAAADQVVKVGTIPESIPVLEGKNLVLFGCTPPTVAVRFDQGTVLRSSEERYHDAEFLVRQTAAYPIVGPRLHATYFRNSCHALYAPPAPMDLRYIVGLLNSRLIRFAYIAATVESGQKAFPQVKLAALRSLPLLAIDFGIPESVAIHDQIVTVVKALLAHRGNHIKQSQAFGHLKDRLDLLVDNAYQVTAVERDQMIQTLAEFPQVP